MSRGRLENLKVMSRGLGWKKNDRQLRSEGKAHKSYLLSKVVAYYGVKAPAPYADGTLVVDNLQTEITKIHNKVKIKSVHTKAQDSDLPRLSAITAPKAAAWMVPPPSEIRYPADSHLLRSHKSGSGKALLDDNIFHSIEHS